MRLAFLVLVTLCAFAGNSILNRLGIDRFGIDPLAFAAIRVWAGAAMLLALLALRSGPRLPRPGLGGTLTLTIYMVGFSLAYLTLDAGLGALILFGVVQLAMFGWTMRSGEPITATRGAGAAIAFSGLVLLLWPGADATISPVGAGFMVCAGVGWAGYTLIGRHADDALVATAGSFAGCALLVLPVTLRVAPFGEPPLGILCAALAGAFTSALGYALWYRVLPSLRTTTAATAQLSVPVLTVLMGVLVLSEPVAPRMVVAGVLVLGGIALSVLRVSAR